MLHINKIRGMVKINAAQKSQLGCRYYLIQIVALQDPKFKRTDGEGLSGESGINVGGFCNMNRLG